MCKIVKFVLVATILACLSVLFSCSTNKAVTDFNIQKRKYNDGWYVAKRSKKHDPKDHLKTNDENNIEQTSYSQNSLNDNKESLFASAVDMQINITDNDFIYPEIGLPNQYSISLITQTPSKEKPKLILKEIIGNRKSYLSKIESSIEQKISNKTTPLSDGDPMDKLATKVFVFGLCSEIPFIGLVLGLLAIKNSKVVFNSAVEISVKARIFATIGLVTAIIGVVYNCLLVLQLLVFALMW